MEMTITRALSELKLLNSRIERNIGSAKFVTGNKKSSKKVDNAYTKEEFINKSKSEYQSILDLITRRNNIKSAIVESNANTVVKINNKEMTVAEAIERKDSINFEKGLLNTMESQYRMALSNVTRNNEQVQEKLDNLLITQFGKDNNRKVSEDEISLISVPYLAQNEWELVDGLNIEEKIKILKDDIENFEHEVDFVLSESNCINKIVIPD